MKRKQKTPGRSESVISSVALIVLAGIGLGVFYTQFKFNPAVSAFQAVTIPTADRRVESSSLIAPFESIEVLTAPEEYHPQTLYEKINGKADLYLSAGFKKLYAQRFRLKNDPDAWLEVLAYEMENLFNAFAVYSLQRREDAIPSDVTRFSYQTGNALFFVHGPFYVEVIAAKTGESVSQALKMSARRFVESRQVAEKNIVELTLFPRENLAVESIELIASAAFGYERLDRVFTGGYKSGDVSLTAFVSRRKNAAEAAELAQGYHDFLLAYGGKREPTRLQNAKAVNVLDTIELIFAEGVFLAGVHEAEDKTAAEALARSLRKKLSEVKRDTEP